MTETLAIRQLPSPNFNDRADSVRPSVLILHYTGTDTGDEAESYYTNAKIHAVAGKISPHYMIDRDGAVTQFVAEDKRAWHAGHSWWDGRGDMNSHSIGIELVNPGHERDYRPFTPAQMESLALLARGILARHDIPPHGVLGHNDVSPAIARNKPDPGELMDWFWLASQGIGLWPQPQAEEIAAAGQSYADSEALRAGLTAYGYDPRVTFAEALSAFQRHFQPEAHHQRRAGQPDAATAARLQWLLKAKAAYKP